MKTILILMSIGLIASGASDAAAFRFSNPKEGQNIAAGSTLKVRVDPGDLPPLFGVLLSADAGIIQAELDSSMPYEWTITLPIRYSGPLTLRATGRRYIPVPNPPQTTVTVNIIFAVLPLAPDPRPGTVPISLSFRTHPVPPHQESIGLGRPAQHDDLAPH